MPRLIRPIALWTLLAALLIGVAASAQDYVPFTQFQTIATTGSVDWEAFAIGSDTYLVVANFTDGNTGILNSYIYRWNGTSFVEFQSIVTNRAADWEAFTIDGDNYLALASKTNFGSVIYRWNGNAFVEVQTIPTNGAFDWEAFTIGNDTYLAVANSYDGTTHNVDSRVYRWDGIAFIEEQAIPTNDALDWEAFTIGSDTYLAVANHYDDVTYNISSRIYRWNGSAFVEVQTIPTNGAFDWEAFTIGNDTYLAVANSYASNYDGYNVDSRIYRWDGVSFVEVQAIPTSGATDWEVFTIGTDTYLAVANSNDGTTNDIDSRIYHWDGSAFAEVQAIPTSSAYGWTAFNIDGDPYLAVANYKSGSNPNIDSYIYSAPQPGPSCQLDLQGGYANGQLTLAYDFETGSTPVLWSNAITIQGNWIPLWSVSLPAGLSYNNAISFNFPNFGRVGVFTQFTDSAGIQCYDFQLIETGATNFLTSFDWTGLGSFMPADLPK